MPQGQQAEGLPYPLNFHAVRSKDTPLDFNCMLQAAISIFPAFALGNHFYLLMAWKQKGKQCLPSTLACAHNILPQLLIWQVTPSNIPPAGRQSQVEQVARGNRREEIVLSSRSVLRILS